MGCWNGTCMVSQLPIFDGDEIAIIPLVETRGTLEHSMCYITHLYKPAPIVLFGEYDDYGTAYNVSGDLEQFYRLVEKLSDSTEEEIMSKERDCNKDKATVYLRYVERGHTNKLVFVMIHKKLYDELIRYKNIFDDNIDLRAKSIQFYQCKDKVTSEIAKDNNLSDEQKIEKLAKIIEIWPYCIDNFSAVKKCGYSSFKTIKSLLSLSSSLNELRKPWMPQIGAGSQSDIEDPHKYLMDFYIKKVEERTYLEEE